MNVYIEVEDTQCMVIEEETGPLIIIEEGECVQFDMVEVQDDQPC